MRALSPPYPRFELLVRAVKWQRAAAGDWGAYAAEISRRPIRR
jgi:hypothetical protein